MKIYFKSAHRFKNLVGFQTHDLGGLEVQGNRCDTTDVTPGLATSLRTLPLNRQFMQVQLTTPLLSL